MTVRKKLGLIIVAAIIIMIGCLVVQGMEQQAKVQKGLDQTVTSFKEKSEKDIQLTLKDISGNISGHMVSLEDSVDKSMLNAAYYIQEMYHENPKMNAQQLKAIAEKTGMTDMLICNETGDFILSTDPASLSLNLFGIWEGYRDLLTQPQLVLPSNLKISEENGSIYKYTAIPRKDGKGCMEAALNSDSIKESLIRFTEGTKGFSSLIVTDNSSLVIMNIGEGKEAADYAEGSITNDTKFAEVFASGEESTVTEEETSSIYYPVKRGDGVAYVLRLTIQKAPYFENVEALADKTTDLTGELKNSLKIGIGVVLILLLIMAAIMLLLINRIMRPIVNMAKVAEKISDGDLNVSIEGKHGGEIGALVKAFNGMTLDLKNMLFNVKQTSNTIQESSSNIRNSVEAVTQSSNEVSTATEEISQGTYDLAQDNSKIYENTSELSAHIESMISSIESVNTNIFEMEQMNKEGIGRLNNLDVHFKDSTHALNEVEEKIETLQEKSNSIGLIVDTIGSIATQTNLLALNASIEAARAGEQGRGFAVVAEEVRKLAELSTKETQEIAQIIQEIITIVESANQKMGITKTATAETSKALTSTKEMFERLNASTNQVGENSNVITESIEYVSDAKNALLNLVESISAISEESAASSKEVSESTLRQTEELEEVSSQIVTMDKIVGELNNLVKKYTMD